MVRIVFPHGLGDVVQAVPYLQRFSEDEGEGLEVFVMNRLPACRQVLSGQPFIDRVGRCLDPWNDANPPNTREGFDNCMDWMRRHHDAYPVYTRPPSALTDPRWSKSLRIASELGVDPKPERPTLPVDKAARAEGRAMVERFRDEMRCTHVALVHGHSGNPTKDVSRGTLDFLARTFFTGGRARLSTYALPLLDEERKPAPLQVQIGAIEAADLFVGVDSGPAHIASATDTPVIWCFTATPVEQAVPLYKRNAETLVYTCGPLAEQLKARWEQWASHNGEHIHCAIEVRSYRGS